MFLLRLIKLPRNSTTSNFPIFYLRKETPTYGAGTPPANLYTSYDIRKHFKENMRNFSTFEILEVTQASARVTQFLVVTKREFQVPAGPSAFGM